jgi:hypothetical protein
VEEAANLVLVTVALVGAARPLLAAAVVLPRKKAVPTASLTEACRVAMSSSSLVIFWLFTTELMNQVVVRHAIPKRRDDDSVGHTRKLMALF